MTPRVAMINFWRNDEGRRINERAQELLSKTYPNLRYIWSVGDSSDNTEGILRTWAYAMKRDVEFVDSTTNIEGREMPERLRRLSKMASITFRHLRHDDDLMMIHESDLMSPPDIVERLLSHGKTPIAAFPMIPLRVGDQEQLVFYDTWAFHRYGTLFNAHPPYHIAYIDRDEDVFEVDGFGSVWIAPAAEVRDMEITTEAVREICRNLRERGYKLWVDSSAIVVQPRGLLETHVITDLNE